MLNRLRNLCLGIAVGFCWTLPAIAQTVTPTTGRGDVGTLVDDSGAFTITGGSPQSATLFHSFKDFSPNTTNVLFQLDNSQAAIDLVIGRVTGVNGSFINAQLALTGGNSPDLFLINPNGITFGQNSSLLLPGSLTASSADTVLFNGGLEFSATAPGSAPLLTVSAPVGLQFGTTPGDITLNNATLAAIPTESLTFLGGNVVMTGGSLTAAGGRVALGGASSLGSATLTNNSIVLSGPRSNVSLSNAAQVNVAAQQGGSIVLQAHNLQIAGGSRLQTGLVAGGRDGSAVSGDITLNATGDTTLSGESFILNEVATNALGNGGDIDITTDNLFILGTSQIRAGTDGTGAAGNIQIMANELISVKGTSGPDDRDISAIFNNPGVSANGAGGDITVTTHNLQLTDGGRLSVEVLGTGNGGNIDITASGNIDIQSSNVGRSLIDAEVAPGSTGTGGNIILRTNDLNIHDGSQITVETFGDGNGGNIDITASGNVDIQSSDVGRSLIDAEVARGSTGTGGNITLRTNDLNIRDGSQVTVGTLGDGNGGNILIQARGNTNVTGTNSSGTGSRIDAETDRRATGDGGNVTIETTNLTIAGGSRITLEAEGVGNGGDLLVRASGDIQIIGTAPNGSTASRIDAESDRRATGNGGRVTLEAANLLITDGSRITTETEGAGNAGTLNIRASESIEIRGSTPVGGFQSRLDAQVERENATGRGGDITLETGQLRLLDGGIISVETSGIGNAGNIEITARDNILVSGESGGSVSRISAEVDRPATGNGGNLLITTNTFQILDGGRISVETEGAGDAGTLRVRASDRIEISGINSLRGEPSTLEAQVDREATGQGGNIFVETGHLRLSEGGRISIDTLGRGQGGNATIQATSIDLSGSVVGDASTRLTAASSGDGPAGSFDIQTSRLALSGNSLIEVSSVGTGGAGNIDVAADQIILTDNGSLQALVVAGDQGNISLNARDFILLRNNSSITTNASSTASGGNISITAPVLIGTENGDIIANAVQGRGGNIAITTQGLLGLEFREQQTSESDITASSEFGINGTVEINNLAVDPSTSLVALPERLANAEDQITTDCASSDRNQFIASGQGGLPIAPQQLISMGRPWADFRNVVTDDSSHVVGVIDETFERASIVEGSAVSTPTEATRWQTNEKGEIALLTTDNRYVQARPMTCLTSSEISLEQ